MKRVATTVLSRSGESALRQYEQVLCEQEDLTPASVRNDLSDVRQFMAWYQALVATVTEQDTLRDRVLIVLLLHTGLRAREVCRLRRDQVKRGLRSGWLEILGNRNKYREVPLNATASKVLEVMCNKQLKPLSGQHEPLLGGASGWDDVSLSSFSSGLRRILHDAR